MFFNTRNSFSGFFTNRLISSLDENTEISSTTKISTVVERLNLSNLNNVLGNNLEDEKLG